MDDRILCTFCGYLVRPEHLPCKKELRATVKALTDGGWKPGKQGAGGRRKEGIMEILEGKYVSPETAYLIEDYPYGFRLRCKIRYWLETNKNGSRLWSQTTNPKRGDVWNKAKASTYAKFGGVMYLNDEGHVHWSGLTEYTDATEAETWLNTWKDGMSQNVLNLASLWVKAKQAYEAKRVAGQIQITSTIERIA